MLKFQSCRLNGVTTIEKKYTHTNTHNIMIIILVIIKLHCPKGNFSHTHILSNTYFLNKTEQVFTYQSEKLINKNFTSKPNPDLKRQ